MTAKFVHYGEMLKPLNYRKVMYPKFEQKNLTSSEKIAYIYASIYLKKNHRAIGKNRTEKKINITKPRIITEIN